MPSRERETRVRKEESFELAFSTELDIIKTGSFKIFFAQINTQILAKLKEKIPDKKNKSEKIIN